MILRMLEGST